MNINGNIRNFCIIAHIDHGKSTISDCLLRITKTVPFNFKKQHQILDDMDLEIEKGITIKSHPIQMEYNYKGVKYFLNLIDTPGHVDFSYEVLKSIHVCEGALLVVDASQGVQAQTIANLYMAMKNNLSIIPVVNKIDIPNVNIDSVIKDVIKLLNCNYSDVILTSAKNNTGIQGLLKSIIFKIPPPNTYKAHHSLQAQIFDLFYDPYKGVKAYCRVWRGAMHINQKIYSTCFINKFYHILELGRVGFSKKIYNKDFIYCGDIGYVLLGVKNIKDVKMGDILVSNQLHCNNKKLCYYFFTQPKPMIYSGVYPIDRKKYDYLMTSIKKLRLNDSSFSYEKESSLTLGFGFRCGFLGILHIDIFKERLKREYGIDILLTTPNVSYKIYLKKDPNNSIIINNPSKYPNNKDIYKVKEPYIKASIITMILYIGDVISLCVSKRGKLLNQNYITNNRVELFFELPLSEVVYDFYTKLKTVTKGYSSFDYNIIGYKTSDLIKLDFYINYKIVDAFSMLINKLHVYSIAKKICNKLKILIPKHQFELPIQAVIGNKVIVRENIKPFRKNVIGKCYGGDVSRKKKLLTKQKEGKKKMRKIGFVNIPSTAFISIINDD